MKLRFTRRAAQDLADIADYIRKKIHKQHCACALRSSNHFRTLFCFRRLDGSRHLIVSGIL